MSQKECKHSSSGENLDKIIEVIKKVSFRWPRDLGPVT